MFLAHLPAGYLASKFLLSKIHLPPTKSRWLFFAALVGSVFPDIDMLYFYTIDNRQHSHHSYWTHIPIFWISILVISYTFAAIIRSRFMLTLSTVFIGSTQLHLLLDSFAGGGIKWLYPLNKTYFSIFAVPGGNHYWVLNYLLHWTALVELSIIFFALFTFFKTRKNKRRTT